MAESAVTATAATDVDAVIIGAGFSGLYMLHKLRNEMGLRARVFEAGGGVGGTWYWNRYPGARSDSDSYIYGFTFDEELWQEWEWSERYPEQHEIRAYLEHVAERYDLLRDITFNTRVESATFDEADDVWTVTTDTGETVTAQYLITAVGALSVSNTPPFPGIDTFSGETYHTGLWPHENVDFTGKRVGVIGTGASAVQAIPLIAQQAADLTVFQRTANYILPANNGPVPEDVQAGPPRRLRRASANGIQSSPFGFELTLAGEGRPGVDRRGGPRRAHAALGRGRLRHLGRRLRRHPLPRTRPTPRSASSSTTRIREKVHDPETAGLLTPTGYPFGVKRVPLDSGLLRDVQPAPRAPRRREGRTRSPRSPRAASGWRTGPSTSSTPSSTPPASTR